MRRTNEQETKPMTAHQLARYLLECAPDLPVVINGWGSAEGDDFEVTGAFVSGGQVALGHGHRDYKTDEWREWCMTVERLGSNIRTEPIRDSNRS
jgi:hypothetical protein